MAPLLRNTLAMLAGVLVGSAVNMALVMAGTALVPPPPGADMTTPEGIAQAMPRMEARHFLAPFLAHALGTLVGALVACLLAASHHARFGHAIGVVFLCGGVAASFVIPAPAWFIATDLVLAYLPMAWLAVRVARRGTVAR